MPYRRREEGLLRVGAEEEKKEGVLVTVLILALLFSLFSQFSLAGEAGYRSQLKNGAVFYPAIAYAKPPTGKLRWRRAVPEEGRRQNANTVSCLQYGSDSFPDEGLARQEDCLYLNVYAPNNDKKVEEKPPRPLPVLVWMHGGALLSGTGLKDFYDGSVFAKRGVIFVSPNYRLGELGFGPKLSPESGSLGLMDLHASLLWVKKNISSFGGDPSKIYLMGHSKGAEAIVALMESGLADGLVKGGISLSGARHFDVGVSGKVPVEPNQFRPGEEKMPGDEILRMIGYHVYNPELPSLRLSNDKSRKERFSLLVTSLYGESFLEKPSNMYCGMRMAALQFFDYIDAALLVLHPFRYEHGDEVRSLFTQDKFGTALADYVAAFVKGEKPAPESYKASGVVTHLYPWFSFTEKDLAPGYAYHFNCEDEAYPGTSKISRKLSALEKVLGIFY